MIYLASPYSHHDPEMMHARYLWVEEACARLFNRGLFVFSPIIHCHEMSRRHKLKNDFAFWRKYNEHMIGKADALAILTLNGWEDSKGVQGEIDFWTGLHSTFPIRLDPTEEIDRWTERLAKGA